MPRIPVGGGSDLITWSNQEPDTTFEGTFTGQRDGRYGALYDLDTPDGTITLASATVLAKKMARIRVGGFVTVVYLGTKPSKKPGAQPFHDFDVFVNDASDLLPVSRTAKDEVRW